MAERVNYLIETLDLQPHPEGGFFRETYRSSGSIATDSLAADYDGSRNYATAIYFLLTSQNFSAFHRIKQDEMWHFYEGSPICIHVISPTGDYTKHIVGNRLMAGETPQLVVPGRSWFASEVIGNDTHALVGCTVSPGFSFNDFELASRSALVDQFPEHTEVISRLTNS